MRQAATRACLAVWLLCCLSARAERPPSPFRVTASLNRQDGGAVVSIRFDVPTEHVLYAERLHFETADGAALTPAQIPAPLVAVDKVTGKEKKMYDRPFAADFKLDSSVVGKLIVTFQGCSNSACYFPERRVFTVSSEGVFAESVPAVDAAVGEERTAETIRGDWRAEYGNFSVVARETGYMAPNDFIAFLNKGRSAQALREDELLVPYKKLGLVATLFLIMIGGVGLNLTPCVLPLIPINLAIIGAGKRARTRRQGFLHGATYGAGMALAYGGLGVVVVLTGSKFGALNSSTWFNGVIALVFAGLGLAMFGVVNLDFSRFESHVGESVRAWKSQSLVAFCLGAMAALLAGACVAPVVVSVLLLAGNLYAKGLVLGLVLPFVLGFGMALPWPFAGASLAFLPKPGNWMKWVKYSFGVLILLFSFYYAHITLNLYRTRSTATALGAAPSGGGAANAGADEALTKGLQQAREQRRSVLIDFQASWCKNCLAMEETVFVRTNVQKRLGDFVVVRYQAERPNEPPARAVLDRFGVMGLPTYVVLAPNTSAASGSAAGPK